MCQLSTLAKLDIRRILKAMKMAVKAVNFAITPSLRRYVDDKLILPVEKLLIRHPAYPAAILELQLVYGTRHHKKGKIWEAIVSLRLPQKHIWKKVFGEDIHAAVDELEDILKREIKKYKERSRSRFMRGARQAKKYFRFARSARLYRKGRIREEGF